MKVLISAFSNLFTDQRIEKVCKTLHENGYSIDLIGNNWGGEETMVRPYSFSRIKLSSKSFKTVGPHLIKSSKESGFSTIFL